MDCCVVTTSKEMDHTCMLASILAESIPLVDSSNVDGFQKVVCVRAAKVPVVKIWDPELYINLIFG